MDGQPTNLILNALFNKKNTWKLFSFFSPFHLLASFISDFFYWIQTRLFVPPQGSGSRLQWRAISSSKRKGLGRRRWGRRRCWRTRNHKNCCSGSWSKTNPRSAGLGAGRLRDALLVDPPPTFSHLKAWPPNCIPCRWKLMALRTQMIHQSPTPPVVTFRQWRPLFRSLEASVFKGSQ